MVQILNGGMQKEHTKIEPGEFSGNTLGGKFGNTILRTFKKLFESISDWFEERLINFSVGVLIKIEQSGKGILTPLINKLETAKAIPDWLQPIFNEIKNPTKEIGALLGGAAGSTAVGGLFGAIFDPLLAGVKYQLNALFRPYIPGINEAVMAWRRGDLTPEALDSLARSNGFDPAQTTLFKQLSRNALDLSTIAQARLRDILPESLEDQYLNRTSIDQLDWNIVKQLYWKVPDLTSSIIANWRGDPNAKDLEDIAHKNGITPEFLEILKAVNRQLPGLTDIRSIYYRENKPESWLDDQLKKQGFDLDTATEIKKILPFFPNVNDLVRFAVREVYSPDIVKKYGQMEDLPDKFIEEAKKAGLPEDQAKNYWAAHWELPPANMGFEMLHRGEITYEELTTLLRTLDIMPYWRDKIIKIAYSPYTRVDVRRMYNSGILSREEVKKSYTDIGYDEEHAENLTNWTVIQTTAAEKNLTKTDVLEGYQRKYFSYGDTLAYIMALGYDQAEAEYYISKVDFKEEKDTKQQMIDLYKDMYKKGIVDDNQVIQELAKYGVTTPEINYYLSKWAITLVGKTTMPAKEDLKKWLSAKIISREIFTEEMRNLGYSDKYIDYYLIELTKKGL